MTRVQRSSAASQEPSSLVFLVVLGEGERGERDERGRGERDERGRGERDERGREERDERGRGSQMTGFARSSCGRFETNSEGMKLFP